MCQSCAMPLQKNSDYGTNKDGTKNSEYCCFCFREGKFTDEGITMNEKKEQLVRIAVEKMDMPEEKVRVLANVTLPKLKRWKK
ncbi:MAG: zinc ribbon domain-containing protein [Candidatus Woesearchaeota archaeon]